MTSRTQQHITVVYLIYLITLSLPLSLTAQSNENDSPFIFGGLAWSPDSEMIAVGTSEGVWLHQTDDLTVVEQLSELPLVTSLDWSLDNRIVFSSDDVLSVREDADIQVLDASTGQVVFDLADQGSRVTSVRWSPDATLFAAALEDGFIHIWDTQTGELVQTIEFGPFRRYYPLTWNSNSQEIATYIYDGEHHRITIWNVETGDIVQSWTDIYAFGSIAWKPGSNIIAVGGSDGFVRLWDSQTGELQYTLEADESLIMALAWSPNRNRDLATIGRTEFPDRVGMTRVWSGFLAPHLLVEFTGGAIGGEGHYTNAIAWSPDGTQLASVSDDGRVFLWDMLTYEQIAVYEGYRAIDLSDR